MTRAIAQTYDIANDHRKQIVCGLLIASAFMLGLYALNIYSVISHSVALERTQRQITSLTQSVDALDAQYLTLSSKVTPDSLAQYGLSQVPVSEFISRTASLGVLGTVPAGGRLADLGGHEL